MFGIMEVHLKPISLIGAGNMGSAIARGLVRSGKTDCTQILVYDVDPGKSAELAQEIGVVETKSLPDAVLTNESTLLLAVKPQVMPKVLKRLASLIHEKILVISIAAGIPTDFILSALGSEVRLIRAMPNAAAIVGESATALCKAGLADLRDIDEALEIFSSFGEAVVVEEKMMNVVTALSASGPGYLFVVMEALTDGAVGMGLDRPTARKLVVQTLAGAAAMAEKSGLSFSDLKDMITSPGGTTLAGLGVMERSGLRGIFIDTVEAAALRAEELGAPK